MLKAIELAVSKFESSDLCCIVVRPIILFLVFFILSKIRLYSHTIIELSMDKVVWVNAHMHVCHSRATVDDMPAESLRHAWLFNT